MSKTARDLAAAYATLPALACKRLCQECCGPVVMTRAELRAARNLAPVAARQTTHDPDLPDYFQPHYDAALTCSLLVDGACSVYAARPLICRLWELVEKLRCPHGCVPERWVTDEEAAALLERVERAGL